MAGFVIADVFNEDGVIHDFAVTSWGISEDALLFPEQVQLLGQSISVGRPSGYVDPSRAQQAAAAAAAALQAFQVRIPKVVLCGCTAFA